MAMALNTSILHRCISIAQALTSILHRSEAAQFQRLNASTLQRINASTSNESTYKLYLVNGNLYLNLCFSAYSIKFFTLRSSLLI